MKVFGIGLEKTGTNSLGRALEILGFKEHKGFDARLLQLAKQGLTEEVLNEAVAYNNFENYPWAFLYKDAYQRFPDAKFILTKRTTPIRWFNSLCHHARRTGPDETRQLVYGHAMPNLFEEEDIQFYSDHIQNVRDFFDENDSSRLLEVCWAHDDGWNELCSFLQCDEPEEEFPHVKK